MKQFTYFAQAANYNCSDASDGSYGAGAFGTCAADATPSPNPGGSPAANTGTSQSTVQPGAPNTGDFFGFVTTGAFSIVLPLVVAIVIVSAATLTIIRRKKSTQR
jgi:hypothetical protein